MSLQKSQPDDAVPFWRDALPAIFVVLWSTGFIGSKMGAPYSEPFTFLGIRFGAAAVIVAFIAFASGARWPNTPARIIHAVIVGVLVHGIYLGGVFWAIDNGLPSGIAALIVSLQPLVAGLAAGPFLDEKVSVKQWAGLLLGFVGVALVVWQQLDFAGSDRSGVMLCLVSMLALAAGTLYQKKFCTGEDLRSHQGLQLAASAVFVGVLSLSLETQDIDWHPEFVFALAWLTLVMSIGTFSLLYLLIRRGAASQVSSLFYLVPPTTALMAFFLFDETLDPLALAGMVVAVAGVALATRR